MKVKIESEATQLCPTLRDPMDCSLPDSSIHGIFQARVLERGAIAFSMYVCICVCVYMCIYIVHYTVEYHSAIKNDKIMPFEAT